MQADESRTEWTALRLWCAARAKSKSDFRKLLAEQRRASAALAARMRRVDPGATNAEFYFQRAECLLRGRPQAECAREKHAHALSAEEDEVLRVTL